MPSYNIGELVIVNGTEIGRVIARTRSPYLAASGVYYIGLADRNVWAIGADLRRAIER